MRNTKIKICGLSRPEDIEAVNKLLPDYIGFVFARKSRRYVTPEQAEKLRGMLDPRILAVGVFVNEEPDKVAELLNRGIIDIAQLHGDEDEAYIKDLRSRTSKALIRAFRLSPSEEDESWRKILSDAEKSSADYVLIDSGAGSGETFDWRHLKDFRREFFLAGGLDAENVEEGILETGAFAVDVSSNVETSGVKDPIKMAEFIAKVRKTDEHT